MHYRILYAYARLPTDKLFGVISGCIARRVVEELVYVVDDVSSYKDETSKVATVNTSNCYWWTEHLVVWQILQRLHAVAVSICQYDILSYIPGGFAITSANVHRF